MSEDSRESAVSPVGPEAAAVDSLAAAVEDFPVAVDLSAAGEHREAGDFVTSFHL